MHAGHEDAPFAAAPEIVGHEEAAAQKIIAQLCSLGVGQIPFAGTHRIEPRPVVDIVAVVKVHGLLHRTRVNAREPADRLKKMTVRARIILGPTGHALRPILSRAIEAGIGSRRIHQAGESELGLFLIVRGERKIVVLDGRVFAEGELESAQ